MVYFIATIVKDKEEMLSQYEDYICEVKPIVEKYGGRYLVRSENIDYISGDWKPERIIIIEWDNKEQLEKCFSSKEYCEIATKRENTVNSSAVIVEV